jgi:hypothetical protein
VLQRNIIALASIACVVLAIFIITLVASAVMIRLRTLGAITVAAVTNFLMAFGILLLGVGFYILSIGANSIAGAREIVGIACGVGFAFLVIGGVGHFGLFRKHVGLLFAYFLTALAVTGLTAAATWMCFDRSAQVTAWASSQSDTALGRIATALGMPSDSATIIAQMQDNLRQLGLAFGVMLGVQIVSLFATIAVIRAIRNERVEKGREGVAHLVDGNKVAPGGAAAAGGGKRLSLAAMPSRTAALRGTAQHGGISHVNPAHGHASGAAASPSSHSHVNPVHPSAQRPTIVTM